MEWNLYASIAVGVAVWVVVTLYNITADQRARNLSEMTYFRYLHTLAKKSRPK